jgi:hypothetical protein
VVREAWASFSLPAASPASSLKSSWAALIIIIINYDIVIKKNIMNDILFLLITSVSLLAI